MTSLSWEENIVQLLSAFLGSLCVNDSEKACGNAEMPLPSAGPTSLMTIVCASSGCSRARSSAMRMRAARTLASGVLMFCNVGVTSLSTLESFFIQSKRILARIWSSLPPSSNCARARSIRNMSCSKTASLPPSHFLRDEELIACLVHLALPKLQLSVGLVNLGDQRGRQLLLGVLFRGKLLDQGSRFANRFIFLLERLTAANRNEDQRHDPNGGGGQQHAPDPTADADRIQLDFFDRPRLFQRVAADAAL